MELKCAVQKYDWGKKGENSLVAKIASLNSNLQIEGDCCYAELWMGTHPNGPSIIADTGESLLDWLSKNPTSLGNIARTYKNDLPFLLKILSIEKPLSIQAHPTKEHAALLNQSNPNVYKDSNHKPEMAIALTPFEAMLGFSPPEEIKKNFESISELVDIIGAEDVNELILSNNIKPHLKKCFEKLMSADPEVIQIALKNLITRLRSSDDLTRTMEKAELVERLYRDFPGDVGVFGPYFFNYIQLNPGEAIFLPPNEPHAYIFGDCIECMACSDNVVRAGLTPKPRDVATLCTMLSYNCSPVSEKLFKPRMEDENCEIFSPPIPDFAVARINVSHGAEFTLKKRNSGSILIVMEGSAESTVTLRKGTILFLNASDTFSFTVVEDIVIYQAFYNIY